MPVSKEALEAAIKDRLQASHVEVSDVSGGCGQMYEVIIVSSIFQGKTTLARHRLVNEQLKDEIAQIHAFTQKSYTEEQWSKLHAAAVASSD